MPSLGIENLRLTIFRPWAHNGDPKGRPQICEGCEGPRVPNLCLLRVFIVPIAFHRELLKHHALGGVKFGKAALHCVLVACGTVTGDEQKQHTPVIRSKGRLAKHPARVPVIRGRA